jgi:hypothetical protein
MTAPTRIGAGNGSGMAVMGGGGRGRPQAVAQMVASACPVLCSSHTAYVRFVPSGMGPRNSDQDALCNSVRFCPLAMRLRSSLFYLHSTWEGTNQRGEISKQFE